MNWLKKLQEKKYWKVSGYLLAGVSGLIQALCLVLVFAIAMFRGFSMGSSSSAENFFAIFMVYIYPVISILTIWLVFRTKFWITCCLQLILSLVLIIPNPLQFYVWEMFAMILNPLVM